MWLQYPIVRAQPVDHSVVRGLCAALCGRYSCLRPQVVGYSQLGRELPALVLVPPSGAVVSPQRVLIAAAFHGQEWLTALVALRLCENLCAALRTETPLCGLSIQAALEGRQVWFVPLVNPDGVAIARYGSRAAGPYAAFASEMGADTLGLWQANARGVDINHNFNAGWAEMQELARKNGKDRPGPRQYPGDSPESEPETRALTNLCRQYAFRHVVALHSQGEELYWRYGENTPLQSELMAQVLGAASGYRVADPEGMATHGGFKDWFIRCFHRPGFTIELGKGTNPLPLSDFEPLYQKAAEMLTMAVVL